MSLVIMLMFLDPVSAAARYPDGTRVLAYDRSRNDNGEWPTHPTEWLPGTIATGGYDGETYYVYLDRSGKGNRFPENKLLPLLEEPQFSKDTRVKFSNIYGVNNGKWFNGTVEEPIRQFSSTAEWKYYVVSGNGRFLIPQSKLVRLGADQQPKFSKGTRVEFSDINGKHSDINGSKGTVFGRRFSVSNQYWQYDVEFDNWDDNWESDNWYERISQSKLVRLGDDHQPKFDRHTRVDVIDIKGKRHKGTVVGRRFSFSNQYWQYDVAFDNCDLKYIPQSKLAYFKHRLDASHGKNSTKNRTRLTEEESRKINQA